jgi:molybdopterin synthase sulfur carrier subunit
MKVKVKLFAIYQEVFAQEKLDLEFPENTPVQEVLEKLISLKPELAKWRKLTRFGVDCQFVEANTILNDGDEVVLIPPVSGG